MQLLNAMHHVILDWFSREGRIFPWRYDSPDPYHVLISEYMLQQTQTSRIAERFPLFLTQFPDIYSLSNASNQEMILAWQGLGYNNRALRLRDCAKAIVDLHDGIVPADYNTLLNLPGIGPYTASAIMSFAYGFDIEVIDVNIRRIYIRMNGFSNLLEMTSASLERFAKEIFPRGKSSEWHQALMDIGAQFCKANNAICELCPLQEHCSSAFNVQYDQKKVKKSEPSHRDIPNRIWRGRTIEFLRNTINYQSDKTELLHGVLGKSIDSKDYSWFDNTIVPALLKDRMITYDTHTNIISISQ
jgi:A/G-specific adenine glycosylase